jgi:predicted naringenin-chalcone synthase
MNPKILSTHIAVPPYTRTTEESMPFVEAWLQNQPDERFREKVLRLFKYSQVDRRYSIMDIDEVFKETSFEEKNNFFIQAFIDLTKKALEGALAKANLKATDIDYIITVSCTGIMIPSIDAYLINLLKMRQDIVRMPITEMGCAGGTSALIYAYNILKANPEKRAAIIAFESPMSTFQHQDWDMANMVSAAIFGDGAVCTILGPSEELKPAIVAGEMHHFYDEIGMMGFHVSNSGLKMILDKEVPNKIEANFNDVLFPFLEKNGLKIEDLDHLIFHPGGKKIVQIVEGLFHQLGKNIDETKNILREYGNMSSATVLYVLDRYLQKNIPEGDYGLMLSFGPGFSAQRVLLKWEK